MSLAAYWPDDPPSAWYERTTKGAPGSGSTKSARPSRATGAASSGAKPLVERRAQRRASSPKARPVSVMWKRNVIEHVGVAPARQVGEFRRRQRVGIAPRHVGVGQRRAKAIEGVHDIAGEILEFGTPFCWYQREEAVELGEHQPLDRRPDGPRLRRRPVPRRVLLRFPSAPARRVPSASRENRSAGPRQCGTRSPRATGRQRASARSRFPRTRRARASARQRG